MRQPLHEDDLIVRTLALGLPSGQRLSGHEHAWPQLVYATSGVMTVATEMGVWVVPTQRAAWIPTGMEHEIVTTGVVAMRTLYFRPEFSSRLPTRCVVIQVTDLLRELVRRIIQTGPLLRTVPEHERLALVLIDELIGIRSVPLQLPLPSDPRARRIALSVRKNPSPADGLAVLCANSGASARTLERIFQRETGLTFGRWRQQARLLKALSLLAEGSSVTSTALDVGYDSTSAFIAMFKRVLGETPGKYYSRIVPD